MATITTSVLPNELQVYYQKVFLKRAEANQIMKEGAQKRSLGQNMGKTLWFNRYTALTQQTTALTEGENPPVSTITSSVVSGVLAEYGLTLKVGKFQSLTSIDVNNAEKIATMGANMGLSLDAITRDSALEGFGSLFGPTSTITASTVASSDVVTAAGLRMVVENLETNKAMPYEDGFYLGKFQPKTKTSLIKDSTWVNAKTYSDVKKLYNGEMGELYQVRCLLSTNGTTSAGAAGTASSSVTLYHNYIHGMDSFGVYDLSGDQPELIIVPNTPDSGNPAGRVSFISWAGSYLAMPLNTSFGYIWKTTA